MENQTQQIQPEIRFIRVKEVAQKLGIGISTVWLYRKKDVSFPQPVSLSERITVWYEHEVNAYMTSKRGMVH